MEANSSHSVLLIEDTASLARVYLEYLRDGPYQIVVADTGRSALDAVSRQTFSAILLDLRLPDMDGMDILRELTKREVKSSVVVITAHGSVNIAVDAMRSGAVDFLLKPFSADRLRVTLENAIERFRLREAVDNLADAFTSDDYVNFIGSSPVMQEVYRIIESAAPSKATTFITGESGTGKELCAEAIHKKSPRAANRFITLNCAAIPRDLMESEIFGHVKGAFTDASSDRDGAASLADGGTLFLDEICEMDLLLQTKLLRFIQTGRIQKVGGDEEEPVDVRFVCATNRNPLQAVADGEFREDLYYRLHVIPIHLPPLRDRDKDIILIANRLLIEFAREEGKQFRGFDGDAAGVFARHSWPGNVRQMQNVLRNIVVLNDGEQITLDMLPPEFTGAASLRTSLARPSTLLPASLLAELSHRQGEGTHPEGEAAIVPLWCIERRAIEDAIERCGGNIPRAAAFLEVSPSTLYRKLQSWDKSVEEDL